MNVPVTCHYAKVADELRHTGDGSPIYCLDAGSCNEVGASITRGENEVTHLTGRL
jgi:hypothetical protein